MVSRLHKQEVAGTLEALVRTGAPEGGSQLCKDSRAGTSLKHVKVSADRGMSFRVKDELFHFAALTMKKVVGLFSLERLPMSTYSILPYAVHILPMCWVISMPPTGEWNPGQEKALHWV